MYYQQSGVFLSFLLINLSHLCIWEITRVLRWSLVAHHIKWFGFQIFHYWWLHTEFCCWDGFWTHQKLLLRCHNGLVWKGGYHNWQCQRLSECLWRHHRKICHCQEHLSFLWGMISWMIILKTKLIGKQYFIFSEKVS